MLIFSFWFCVFLVFYIYIGYPLIIKMLPAYTSPYLNEDLPLHFEPYVSILIAAFNEEKDIMATIQNKIDQKYPKEKFEIIVVSDESSDKTDLIVESFSNTDVPVTLLRQVPRRGKTAGLNLIVPKAKGEILVFSDANSIYEENALRNLVNSFKDPKTGYVTGKMVYINSYGSIVGDGCSAYMKYENMIRADESKVGSIVGVDGGIDAMRKSLYEPLNTDQLPDFVQPLKVVEKGFRVVYESKAILKEETLSNSTSEYTMRVRVTLRALWALKDMSFLLNPFKYGLFSFQLFSHKLLRYLAFIPIIAVFTLNLFLYAESFIFVITLALQLIFYMLSWIGKNYQGNEDSPIYLSLPYYFSILNIACLHAFWRFIKGEKQVIWKPRVG